MIRETFQRRGNKEGSKQINTEKAPGDEIFSAKVDKRGGQRHVDTTYYGGRKQDGLHKK